MNQHKTRDRSTYVCSEGFPDVTHEQLANNALVATNGDKRKAIKFISECMQDGGDKRVIIELLESAKRIDGEA